MAPTNFQVSLFRPEDQLLLDVYFYNVDFIPPQAGNPGRIVSNTPSTFLILKFQTQHITEQAFYRVGSPTDDPLLPPGSVGALPSGPSRLVFRIPQGTSFAYETEGILQAVKNLPLVVAPVADYEPIFGGCSPISQLINRILKRTPPYISELQAMQTALEIPYRLFISPDSKGTWDHAIQPVTHDEYTELWHTRMGTKRSDGKLRVRAIWSPDYIANNLQPHEPPFQPFRMAMDGRDRNELVHLTSNWHLDTYMPLPADVDNLMLSSLGAYLKLKGHWDPPYTSFGSLTVTDWKHNTTLGRDHYVSVVYAGFLFPYGHAALLVKVTERKFHLTRNTHNPGHIAYLFQRKFIIVRQPLNTYTKRDLPFRSVEIQTRVTPDIVDPGSDPLSGLFGLNDEAFWVRVPVSGVNEDFQFHLVGTDWVGNEVKFTSPLIFVSKNVDTKVQNPPNDSLKKIIQNYNQTTSVTDARRKRPFEGQSIAYAQQKTPGDTSLETDSLSQGVELVSSGIPHFRPLMSQAEVDVPAVRRMLGKSVPSTIQFETTYLNAGGNSLGNKSEVFAKLVGATPLKFDTEKVGGMVAPDIGISSLSRSLGPMGGTASKVISGDFDPKDIFTDTIKLLGGIILNKIIQALDIGSDLDKIPRFVSIQEGNKIKTSYTWVLDTSKLNDTGLFVPSSSTQFTLSASTTVPLDGGTPEFSIEGKLTDFTVKLLPQFALVDVSFNQVRFYSLPNKKPDVDVDLGQIKFVGILEFVSELAKLIPMDGFSDPPILDIGGDGITLGYSLGLPNITLGAMSLQNISFAASVFLPFGDKELNFHFAFCKREQPLTLTIYLFGGGGFFSIDVGIAGVRNLEAALEFGASVALDLGVASGKACIMGGFYFQMSGSDFTLTGYIRAAGSLNVLGIITVSLEFYLSLTYSTKGSPDKYPGKLWGQCKITVEIEILFFSISVSVSMERQFAGADPAFQQLIGPSDWELYCDAFDPAYPAVVGG